MCTSAHAALVSQFDFGSIALGWWFFLSSYLSQVCLPQHSAESCLLRPRFLSFLSFLAPTLLSDSTDRVPPWNSSEQVTDCYVDKWQLFSFLILVISRRTRQDSWTGERVVEWKQRRGARGGGEAGKQWSKRGFYFACYIFEQSSQSSWLLLLWNIRCSSCQGRKKRN